LFIACPPIAQHLYYISHQFAGIMIVRPPGRRFMAFELTRASGFQGVDGLSRFRPEGASERGFAIMEVQK
jgi:branched-chain amino acid transport system substrate-binding protein